MPEGSVRLAPSSIQAERDIYTRTGAVTPEILIAMTL
ncbi:MAG: hypothetical protein ACI86M_001033 [Saprospiraceae bacterium]|jgi:hypothetical protein